MSNKRIFNSVFKYSWRIFGNTELVFGKSGTRSCDRVFESPVFIGVLWDGEIEPLDELAQVLKFVGFDGMMGVNWVRPGCGDDGRLCNDNDVGGMGVLAGLGLGSKSRGIDGNR